MWFGDVMDNIWTWTSEGLNDLAPWIKDDQIEYDSQMNAVGVSGAHTPFHWKCRTGTAIV